MDPNPYAITLARNNSLTDQNVCKSCGVSFSTLRGLREHWIQSRRHHYCQYHSPEPGLHFSDQQSLLDHYHRNHRSYCDSCRKFFKSPHGLVMHLRTADAHNPCAVRRPKGIHCPLKCGRTFTTHTFVFSHLEIGSCTPGFNRTFLDDFIHQCDKDHAITDPPRTRHAQSWESDSGEVSAESTDSSDENSDETDDTSTIASRHSAIKGNVRGTSNGLQCYICGKLFNTPTALSYHINSPYHDTKKYVCPVAQCQRRFALFSGFRQHVERGGCGVASLRRVQGLMDRVIARLHKLGP